MEEAYELLNYLPLSFKSPKEKEYIEFLWDTFKMNYENEKFQFAFLAYHMLAMSSIFFNIWRIKQTNPDGFKNGLIGFGKDIEKTLINGSSPFVFSAVNERTVLRFLKLIDCDNSDIGRYAKLVDYRNDSAHPNGNIYFSNQSNLDEKINEVLRVVAGIHEHSRSIMKSCYLNFLTDNNDPEDWQYSETVDQVREVLIHENYLSQRDVDFCCSIDVKSILDQFPRVAELHDVLIVVFKE
jgi:hypothetical protein